MNKPTIEEMREIAKKKDGKCLSTSYVNSQTKLRWQCDKGHSWEARPNNIKNGTWCPVCFGSTKKCIEDMKSLAQKKGGRCLSKTYNNTNNKLQWQCKNGHKWWATPSSIQNRGTWCSTCSSHVSERICREYFEKIFNKKFIKIRPKWLKSPKGGRLELDGYCKKLNLAFEYQGIQHFSEFSNFFHKNVNFDNQKERDKLKKELCKKNKIVLIEIPHYISYEKMGKFISDECKKNKIDVPTKELPDYKTFEIYPDKIETMRKLAQEKGGKCLSNNYINNAEKLKWECKAGHRWWAPPHHIRAGHWCSVCQHKETAKKQIKYAIEDMRKLANEKNGLCLSKAYVDSKHKLHWQCEKGHTWFADRDSIACGHWCPTCGGSQKLSIEEMREIAKKKGGKCLSADYINAKTKLLWECEHGHKWEAVPISIKTGSWCPKCNNSRKGQYCKDTIENMQEIAKKKEGVCCSKNYVNNSTKLEWQCKNGHKWFASPNNIKNGRWCPMCAASARMELAVGAKRNKLKFLKQNENQFPNT